MQVKIEVNERWPDYSIHTASHDCGLSVEVPGAVLARFSAALREYNEATAALEKHYKPAQARRNEECAAAARVRDAEKSAELLKLGPRPPGKFIGEFKVVEVPD